MRFTLKSAKKTCKALTLVTLLFFSLVCTNFVTSLTISSVQYAVSPNNNVMVTYKLTMSPEEQKLFDLYSFDFMMNMTEQGWVKKPSKNMLSFTLPNYTTNFSVDNKTAYFFPGFYYRNLTEIPGVPQDLEIFKIFATENPAPKIATITWPDGKSTNFVKLDYVPNIYHVMTSEKKVGK